ncbi:hypothetical protein [Metabacillus litoralis]|uniref:hypothetical protein n=1 Tax=Metabacillus litoralis TaxID=152268 RepID=UPI001CFE83F8|nr:hypothetical protein [Metabacillus litoralis]
MKLKQCSFPIFIMILFTYLLIPYKSFATSWPYPFVVWDGYIYVVNDEYVTDIGSEIGRVTRFSDMEQYAGNFSNSYEIGTKYYSIQGIGTEEAIAIQLDNGRFKKAVRKEEYTYGKEMYNFFRFFIFLVFFIVIIGIGILIIEKKKVK